MGRKPTFWEWISLQYRSDFAIVQGLGPVVGAALFIVGIFLCLCVLVLLPLAAVAALRILLETLRVVDPVNNTGVINTGVVIVALLGAPFVIWRAIVAQRTVDIAEQGHRPY